MNVSTKDEGEDETMLDYSFSSLPSIDRSLMVYNSPEEWLQRLKRAVQSFIFDKPTNLITLA